MTGKMTITQATFDAVVNENINEFDMTPDEAVAEAIKQFSAQGVDLFNIIKEAPGRSGDNSESNFKLKEIIEDLKKILSDNDISQKENLFSKLNEFKSECDIDLAHRCYAGSNVSFPTLFQLMEKFPDDESAVKILEALESLLNGQPDLLTMDTTTTLCGKLRDCKCSKLCHCLLGVILNCCIKHEENRQLFVENNVIELLIEACKTFPNENNVIVRTCKIMKSLTSDDDMRVAFGKGHEHARMLVGDHGALETLINLAADCEEVQVLTEVFGTLTRLAVRNEFCEQVQKLGGLEIISKAFAEHVKNQEIARQGLLLLKALAGNDDVKAAIVKTGGVGVVLTSMNTFQSVPGVAEAGCACLAVLALRVPDHCKKIVDDGGVRTIVTAMETHMASASVQKSACMAVRNLVARTKQFCPLFLELGVENLLNKIRTCHPKVDDAAKSALRDLGCKVELKEQWKGEKGSIENN